MLSTKLSTLQNLLQDTVLFIIDEISIVLTKLLSQINQNYAKIFELPTTGSAIFGKVLIILLFRDFFQFPPIGEDLL